MLRITAGEFKGRSLKTPPEKNTRPSSAKLRQALLNSIQFNVSGARVLDLFAGSGALSFEALSRGAEYAVMVENYPQAQSAILENAQVLKVMDKILLIKKDFQTVHDQLLKLAKFDIVFIDPPYDKGFEMDLLEKMEWSQLLAEDGILCLEWSPQKGKYKELPETVGVLTRTREKNYGDSILSHYVLK